MGHMCKNIVLTLRQVMRTRWSPPVRRKRRTDAIIRGIQVYKHSPHLAQGDEDHVEGASEGKRRTEAAICGTQVYKYSPHLVPGDEDQVEAASEEKEEN